MRAIRSGSHIPCASSVFVITRSEAAIRRRGHGNYYKMLMGATMTTVIVAAAYAITDQTILLASKRSQKLGVAVEILLGWTCVAARNLEQEASRIVDALGQGDLPRARRLLSRIVGRDTASLNESEICRAVIESVAESACDGILAPIYFIAIGGAPMAMAYKAVNTLDSMIGHTDERYLYLGKAAARLDDLAQLSPLTDHRSSNRSGRGIQYAGRLSCRVVNLATGWAKAQKPQCRSTRERDGRRGARQAGWSEYLRRRIYSFSADRR